MSFSVVIPVYNRPQELDDLLGSIQLLPADAEILVVEDGSGQTCDHIVKKYADQLPVRYLYQDNAGPAMARNYGAAESTQPHLIFFDSDCIIPENYFEAVSSCLKENDPDYFGGPDQALPSFSAWQQAINYAMTSWLTTGGIRGKDNTWERFKPRSFNMGVKKTVFEEAEGFRDLRFGEDIDLSLRLEAAGYRSRLIPEAFVYHKRRTSWKPFFKQVFNSGMARILLSRLHPGSHRLVHALPFLFTAFTVSALMASLFTRGWSLLPNIVYALLVWVDSLISTRRFTTAMLSVVAAHIQLWGYGLGYLAGWWRMRIRGEKKSTAFEKSFYR